MADDIVTRLRSTDYEYEDAELAFDAADEIERLREELLAERNTLSAIYALATSVSIDNTAKERAWTDIKHMTFDAWDQRRKEARRG